MNNHSKVQQITRMAILVAIIFLLAFTPLGYLTIGPIAATTIQMPVIVGAVIMGPTAGAVLGFYIAGLFSFRLPFGLSLGLAESDENGYSRYEPVIILAAAFLIGSCLKAFVSDAIWDKILSSPLWENIK